MATTDSPRPDDSPLLAEQPGRYELKEKAGTGGQAVVNLVVDRTVGREIAMKVLHVERGEDEPSDTGSLSSTPEGVRFLREARVTAQLEHPNIVPVHELGRRPDGTPYYTMRFVRGRTLAGVLKEAKDLPARLRHLKTYLDLCNAIAFAHSRGVVHRDIKPANVMVGEFGETVVIDWGIAKVKGLADLGQQPAGEGMRLVDQTDGEQTVAGAIGTPSFMSPEQAQGHMERIDHRSDVWSLGVVLYLLLTGKRPFTGESEAETFVNITSMPLPDPAKICPDAPPELVAVVKRALQKKQEDRYQSARELAAEVDAYLTGDRVGAYEYSSRELLLRFARKNRATVIAAGLVVATVVVALVVVTFMLKREQESVIAQIVARQGEARARAQEHQERLEADLHLAQAYAEKADRLAEDGRHLEARVFAAASLASNPAHPKSRRFEEGYAAAHPEASELRLAAASALFRFEFVPQVSLKQRLSADVTLVRLAWFPDGSRVASIASDGGVRVWPAAGGPVKLFEGVQGRGFGVAVSPDGARLAGAGQDGKIHVWDAATAELLAEFGGFGDVVETVQFSPDGTQLAGSSRDSTIRIFGLATRAQQGLLDGNCGGIEAFAFAPKGMLVAAGCADGRVLVWDRASNKVVRTIAAHDAEGVQALAISPDGLVLATGGGDRIVRTFELSTGKQLHALDGHRNGVVAVAFSPDGRRLASSSYDHTARIWDVASGAPLTTIGGHDDFVFGLGFSPDGASLATASYDGNVRIWGVAPGRKMIRLTGHSGVVYGIDFSPDGARVATTGWDGSLRVWDAHDGERVAVFPAHAKVSDGVVISPDGRLGVTVSRDKTVRIWDFANLEPLGILGKHEDIVMAAAFSPDGNLLATAGQEGRIRLFDVDTRTLLRTVDAHTETINQLAFSRDGRLLASSANDRTVKLWDPANGAPVRTFTEHTDWVSGVSFSPDGTLLASSGKDGQVLLHVVADGSLRAKITGHRGWVNSVRFSPDGRLIATASDDTTVRVTDVETLSGVLLVKTSQEAAAVEFSPDGRTLAVADGEDVALYPLDFSTLEADAAAVLTKAQADADEVLDGFELRSAPAVK